MKFNIALGLDFYKTGHEPQFPEGTTRILANGVCRGSRIPGITSVNFFGLQYYILEYLLNQWNDTFFKNPDAVDEYKEVVEHAIQRPLNVSSLRNLHKLGYMPVHIKALPEGVKVPLRYPLYTIHNTINEYFWLTNFLETQMSATLWGMINSMTLARDYYERFQKYASETGSDPSFIRWQGHDFSMRGMFGMEASVMSAAAHLAAGFTGSDTVPAILFAKKYYQPIDFIAGSVVATEHAVMCAGGQTNELETFRRLITEVYPKGIVSIVSDSWDFWLVITSILPLLKDTILKRDGKLVIRPDSGDPVKIICGDPESNISHVRKGLIECLWDLFGGTKNDRGFKILDPHIGAIYGDSITPDRQKEILEGLKQKGFASSNMVLGIGSYTYQYNTRDTFGFAIKATYTECNGVQKNLFKNPATDNGLKKSLKGLPFIDDNGVLTEEVNWNKFMSDGNALSTVFVDGQITRLYTLDEIRSNAGRSIVI